MTAELPKHARAVVVGGGIAGTSAAYHLAVEGWTDVLLLEQNALGAGTTWHAAGAVGRLRVTGSLARMNDRSARLYSQIEAETGVPVGYKRVGGLALAQRPERIAQLRRSASMAAHFGVDVQIIARDEVAQLWPLAQLDDVIGAAWLPDDGRAEPGQLPARRRRGRAPPGRDRVRGRPRARGAARRPEGDRCAHRSRRRDGRRGRARVRHVDAPARARLRRQRPAASRRAPLPPLEPRRAATSTARR